MPGALPPLTYYQLWHELSHASAAMRWLREQVREAARSIAARGMLRRPGAAAGDGTAVVANP